ncbi:hypothetical protein RR46_07014 [Papilio xuthus]|uniref:Uncharacterized protein n=1 Tax=Papilio xuthus TaxID=66420 RepID=A0A194Q4Y9_PAPXU|nr:hypothetical protein RR46_07014 [Papilio xuthus]
MGELQYPGAPSVDDERQYRAPFRRAPQYRWPAPQPPQPSAFAPWRRAPAPPRPPDYRRSASYPGKPDESYQENIVMLHISEKVKCVKSRTGPAFTITYSHLG